MFGYLVLLFTIIPAGELAILIAIGRYIGVWNTVLIIVLTGVTGAYLARMQGLLTFYRLQQDLAQGRMPADRFVDGFIILCSGILLLTPGFITDCIGFLGLIPFTRHVFKLWLKKSLKNKLNRKNPKIHIIK
ncbi:MAG: membrane protein FxsA [Elusimicrobia bacterium]|nr:membrane protein FxsA [Elusimicrobiota bacterium]MBD3411512.1 membrane protein FxsA [Elusimicrobiota bacterium]